RPAHRRHRGRRGGGGARRRRAGGTRRRAGHAGRGAVVPAARPAPARRAGARRPPAGARAVPPGAGAAHLPAALPRRPGGGGMSTPTLLPPEALVRPAPVSLATVPPFVGPALVRATLYLVPV